MTLHRKFRDSDIWLGKMYSVLVNFILQQGNIVLILTYFKGYITPEIIFYDMHRNLGILILYSSYIFGGGGLFVFCFCFVCLK